jgi:hypothetical protein
MTCEHEVVKLEGIRPDVYDDHIWNAAVDALNRGDMVGGALVYNATYCSICPTHAEYRCSTKQHFGKDAKPLAKAEELLGCGLLLCQDCKDLMEKIIEHAATGWKWEEQPINVLDRLVSMAAKNVHHDGVRADASFLMSTGHLMLRMGQGMGLPEAEREGWMKDHASGGRIEELDSDEDHINEEQQAMLDRIGKGRGTWMEKGKIKMPPRLERGGEKNSIGPALAKSTQQAKPKSLPAPAKLKTGAGSGSEVMGGKAYAERTGKSIADKQIMGGEGNMDFFGFSMGSAKPTIEDREVRVLSDSE